VLHVKGLESFDDVKTVKAANAIPGMSLTYTRRPAFLVCHSELAERNGMSPATHSDIALLSS